MFVLLSQTAGKGTRSKDYKTEKGVRALAERTQAERRTIVRVESGVVSVVERFRNA